MLCTLAILIIIVCIPQKSTKNQKSVSLQEILRDTLLSFTV
ncbi:hypothetical protein COPCOM_00493 [Coprococcus comes ATCC 27758]|uniref:Uncharacterized protein n=1 Tax=Coprococcus comes ATCC 27758 TaxID=470146 RepID=C0B5S2_9FIRM|nr:hypothetical protein COPCOM_00493 [Coprococcus comes ATCC 27758]